MDEPTDLVTAAPDGSGRPWINGRAWDLRWLIGSATVVPVVLALVWLHVDATVLNLAVAAVVGGPHLFSTFLATYQDPAFRRAHWPMLAAATVLVPAFVITMTLADFQVLLSVFIFAASFHVIQQNAYLADVYRRRARTRELRWSRAIDAALLALCFYPIASYKLVHDRFALGDVEILIPPSVKTPATYWIIAALFTLSALAWLAKTVIEHRRGLLNRPKTLLIGVTAVIAFFVPMAGSGERLELAFQSVNAWHSVQYLGIVWLVLKLRRDEGLLASPFVARLAGPGRAAARFYGLCFGLTLALFGVVLILWRTDPFHLPFTQYYYMTTLSCLLIHYTLDGFLFTVSTAARASATTLPFAAPALS